MDFNFLNLTETNKKLTEFSFILIKNSYIFAKTFLKINELKFIKNE